MSLKIFIQSPDTFGERRYDPEITIQALKVSRASSLITSWLFHKLLS
jgi:hypothetical protein